MRQVLKSLVKRVWDPVQEARHERRRTAELKGERRHVDYDELFDGFCQLPIPGGKPVLVHSSLKSLGYVEGGAETVIDAMIDAIVEYHGCTLMLPTYSIDGSMASSLRTGRSFDVSRTPSNLGRLPEVFRQRPGAVRSVHPTHSFAAIGRDAAYLVDGQLNAKSNFGEDTPMMRLKELGGSLLGVGTHIGRVTLYHCIEDSQPFPVEVYTSDSPFRIQVIDAAGRSHERDYSAHSEELEYRIDRPNSEALRDLYKRRFEQAGALNWHRVAEANCWMITAEHLYSLATDLKDAGVTIYANPDLAAEMSSRDTN